MPKGGKLSDKQRLFVTEYMIDKNATQAAIRAGYSKKTAHSQGPRLLENVGVAKEIEKRIRKATQAAEVTAEYVLRRLREIDEMDIFDILDEEFQLKPINEWPKVWRTSLSGMDIHEIFERSSAAYDEEGKRQLVQTIVKKIKWPDKLKNLELLGKHVNVGAFKEKMDHYHHMTLEDLVCGAGKDGDGSDQQDS